MNIQYNPPKNTWDALAARPMMPFSQNEQLVKEIFMEVRAKGDAAVQKYAALFDGTKNGEMMVSQVEIIEAIADTPAALKEAIAIAKANIENFHIAQKTLPVRVTTMKGVQCWIEKKPVQTVGLYIPGGSAPLFSTVLMLAIPAVLAGCREIILCSPADESGKINPAILYAANLCGISKIVKAGGIQAIAAMVFGTAAVPRVNKIFGPGNQYVTAAKQYALQFGAAIDIPAGPSELVVLADDSAIPAFVAADLLSQAEHGSDSQVVLVSTSEELLTAVAKEVRKQAGDLPRKDIILRAIDKALLLYISSPALALEFVNKYAPEHLIICSKDRDYYLENLTNAGSVFIGNFTPESAGDYASGTNHTLPTNGAAACYSGVCLDSFLKSTTFQEITEAGIRNIGKTIEVMAEAEGLLAHKNAVSLRLAAIDSPNK